MELNNDASDDPVSHPAGSLGAVELRGNFEANILPSLISDPIVALYIDF